MLGAICRFRKDQHRIIHPKFENWIKRHVPDERLRDSLFVYYHRIHKTFVVAQWKSYKRGFVDVLNLDTEPRLYPEQAKQLLDSLRHPVSGHEIAENLRLSEWDQTTNQSQLRQHVGELQTWKPKIQITV